MLWPGCRPSPLVHHSLNLHELDKILLVVHNLPLFLGYSKGWKTLSVKGWVVNIGSFAVHVTAVIVHSGGSTKAAIDYLRE